MRISIGCNCRISTPPSGGTAGSRITTPGNGDVATPELGRLLVEHRVAGIVKAIGTVKADTTTGRVQQEFFDKVLK